MLYELVVLGADPSRDDGNKSVVDLVQSDDREYLDRVASHSKSGELDPFLGWTVSSIEIRPARPIILKD